MRWRWRHMVPAVVLLTGALGLAGCGDSHDATAELSVGASYMPQPVSADMAAGFLTITNKSGTEDKLTSVTSDVAGQVTMHDTVGGAMREVRSFAVPAHGQLVFRSGGNHLMFENLKRKPKQGDTVTLKLKFAESDPVTVEMPVKSATYTPSNDSSTGSSTGHGHGHGH